jgi:hypothetical protein
MRALLFFAFLGALLWIVGARMFGDSSSVSSESSARPTPSVADETLDEVTVTGVYLTPGADSPAIFLREVEGSRTLPIWIGFPEADAIRRHLDHDPPPRPMTHEILVEALRAVGATVSRSVVTELRDQMFFARVDLVTEKGTALSMESRPSDAIALALGMGAPIFVHRTVMEEAARLDLVQEDEPGFEEGLVGCGIFCQPVDDELAGALGVEAGVLVADVTAAQAATGVLERGDVLLELGGEVASDVERVRELLDGLDAGDALPVVVMRGGERTELELTCR